MLTDPTQPDEFRSSKHWKSPLLDFQLRVQQTEADGPAYRSNSLSGNERNRLLIAGPEGFHDESLVSGIDCKEDARSFATFDFDQDGWLDIALASTNAPRLRIFRNCIGKDGENGHILRLKLTGTISNRDAIGTRVTIHSDKGTRQVQKSLGEGLSSQNSSTLHLTFATGESPESLAIQWPSGKTTTHPITGETSSLHLTEPAGN